MTLAAICAPPARPRQTLQNATYQAYTDSFHVLKLPSILSLQDEGQVSCRLRCLHRHEIRNQLDMTEPGE